MINWIAYEIAKIKAKSEVEHDGIYPLDAGQRALFAAFTGDDGVLDLNPPVEEIERLCVELAHDVGLGSEDHHAWWLEFVEIEKAWRDEA